MNNRSRLCSRNTAECLCGGGGGGGGWWRATLWCVVIASLCVGPWTSQAARAKQAETKQAEKKQAEKKQAEKKQAAAATDEADAPSPSDTGVSPGVASGESDEAPAAERRFSRQDMLLASLTIFLLAVFVGFEIITKVPPTLHTPLMSGSNAISGITIVGALLVAGKGLGFASFLGFVALILAGINVVGGFLVTHRMLAMFKKR